VSQAAATVLPYESYTRGRSMSPDLEPAFI
jgi:hypothetical protein